MDDYKKILNEKRKELVQKLDLASNDLYTKLRAYGVISFQEEVDCRSQTRKSRQVKQLLDILQEKNDPRVYEMFCNALVASRQQHIVHEVLGEHVDEGTTGAVSLGVSLLDLLTHKEQDCSMLQGRWTSKLQEQIPWSKGEWLQHNSPPPECKEHKAYIDHYCQDCEMVCCQKCAALRHNKHSCSKKMFYDFIATACDTLIDRMEDYRDAVDNLQKHNIQICRHTVKAIDLLQQDISSLRSCGPVQRERLSKHITKQRDIILIQKHLIKSTYIKQSRKLGEFIENMADITSKMNSENYVQVWAIYKKKLQEFGIMEQTAIHRLQLHKSKKCYYTESRSDLFQTPTYFDKPVVGITMVNNVVCVLFDKDSIIALYSSSSSECVFIQNVKLPGCSDKLHSIITLNKHPGGFNTLVGDLGKKCLWFVTIKANFTVGNVRQQRLTYPPYGLSLGFNNRDIIVNDMYYKKIHIFASTGKHIRTLNLPTEIKTGPVFSTEMENGFLVACGECRKFIWIDPRGQIIHTATESESKVSFFSPWHIQRVPGGRVLVSDHKNLYVIDSQRQVRELLSVEENTERPGWIYLNSAQHRLFVTGWPGSGNEYISTYDWRELAKTAGALTDNLICIAPENDVYGDNLATTACAQSTVKYSRPGTDCTIPSINITQHQVSVSYCRSIPLRCRAEVRGVAVVHDMLCVVHYVNSKLWLYHKVTGEFIKRVPVPGLRAPRSLVFIPKKGKFNLLVGDYSSKTMIFIALSSSLEISDTRTIQLDYIPHGVSLGLNNSDIIVHDKEHQRIQKYNDDGGYLSADNLNTDIIHGASFCTKIESGYIIADSQAKSFIWTDNKGQHMRTTSQTVTGESFCRPWHIVRVCAGHLLLSDCENLYTVDRNHQVRLLHGVEEYTDNPRFMCKGDSDYTLYIKGGPRIAPYISVYNYYNIPLEITKITIGYTK